MRSAAIVCARACRTWCLTITYGYCFGVELTIDNIINEYIVDQFGLALTKAGSIGASFGLMNIVTRTAGGACARICGPVSCSACRRVPAPARSCLLLRAMAVSTGSRSGALVFLFDNIRDP
jgi:nitrate/nitrite transporter NarK